MSREIVKYSNDKKWVIVNEEGQYYLCEILNNEYELVYTPKGNVLATSYFILADRILVDLEKYKLNFLESKSILSWHCTMLDDFKEKEDDELIALFDKEIFSKEDWSYDISPEEIFGDMQERVPLIQEWLYACTKMQLTAVYTIANQFRSINIAYTLALFMEQYQTDREELKIQFKKIAKYANKCVYFNLEDSIIFFDLFNFYYGIHFLENGNILLGKDDVEDNDEFEVEDGYEEEEFYENEDDYTIVDDKNKEENILDFQEWLIQENFSREKCNEYYSIIKSIDSQAIRIRKSASNLLASNSAEECFSVVKDLYQSVEFIISNQKYLAQYDSVLALFLKYLGMENSGAEIKKLCYNNPINLYGSIEETVEESIDGSDIEESEEKDFEKIFREWLIQEEFTSQAIQSYFETLKKIDNYAIQVRKSHTNFLGSTCVKECLEIAKDLYRSEAFISLCKKNNCFYDETLALFFKCIQYPLKEKELQHLVLTEDEYTAVKIKWLNNCECRIQDGVNMQAQNVEEMENIYSTLIGLEITDEFLVRRNYYHYTNGKCDKKQPYILDLEEFSDFDLLEYDVKSKDIISDLFNCNLCFSSDFFSNCWGKRISVLENNEHVYYQIMIWTENRLIKNILVVKDDVVHYDSNNLFIGMEVPISHNYLVLDLKYPQAISLEIKRELSLLAKKICLSNVLFYMGGSFIDLPKVLKSEHEKMDSKFSFRLQSGYRDAYMEMDIYSSNNLIVNFDYTTYAADKNPNNTPAKSCIIRNERKEFIDMLLAFNDLYEKDELK